MLPTFVISPVNVPILDTRASNSQSLRGQNVNTNVNLKLNQCQVAVRGVEVKTELQIAALVSR